jgi:hypothetical protein
MTIPEIAPCPFCGSSQCSPNYHNHRTWVECDACGARGQSSNCPSILDNRGPSEGVAIRHWNQRAGHSIAGYEGTSGLYYSKLAAVANGEQRIEPIYRVKK